MANRRMFAKSVIGSARFRSGCRPTSMLLYYDLWTRADDNGIVNAFRVMRITAANVDDLRLLISKGFVTILDDEEWVVRVNELAGGEENG